MKTITRSSILLFSGLILTACGEMTDNGSTPEDVAENWPTYIQEGEAVLESYSSDTQLDLEMSMGPGLMTEEDSAFIHVQMVGDLEQGYIEDDVSSLYFEGNDVYVEEGTEWVHYPDSGPIDYPSWYPNIIDSLVEIEAFIEATHTDGSVALTYDGNDPEVWNAFEEEFQLSIDGISPENINIDLEATMDDENYYLQDLYIDIMGEETADEEVELGSINITIDVEYYDQNEIDLTEMQEEITQNTNN